ncbi:hypothetical protein LMH87_006100 [Akanthomyces muscarius]|uniref:glucan endo-1,3-beta-D-glucosidase n=1 Tax=Akanthomyces muscarius TaxID=2231603 RepID=A0A9W8UST7_AKAMU|nr:hypothetical protein LMH87_006100 [Akanthomyces muscarius]KAJ4164424.1 hypothetical protein LMH87_006100 [Akanthomyces muscarius]
MKHATIALITAAASMAAGLTQDCTGTAKDEGGNWFCGVVNHILYQGIGGSGSYEAVTAMTSTGECKKATKSYSGPLAPLNEGLSLHFRGPLNLKEFAVYTPSSQSKWKRDEGEAKKPESAHGHHRIHAAKKKQRQQKRADWVTATIDGKVVSWENNWFGGQPSTAPAAAPASPTATASAPADSANPPPVSAPAAAPRPKPAASGQDWDRTSYYSADSQTAENLVFLGNYGGQGSGVWDPQWGNSLSFLNAAGSGGASSAQVLSNVDIPSNKEFSIFSGQPCDESCGFSRAQDVAYKGFEGASKIFLFNFKMPMDGNRGFNGDMPAIWALNAAVPRAAQYSACSCWPKCGEFDFFEVLASGDDKCKSTVHLAPGGGSSDYFPRPTDAYVKAAVVFDGDAGGGVAIRVLADDADFSKGLDAATVQSWVSSTAPSAITEGGATKKLASSLFQIAGGSLG